MTSEEPMSCEQCGKPHVLRKTGKPSCVGHWKSDPTQPCGQPKMKGQNICRKHGGKAKQNLAAAQRRRDTDELVKAARTFGVPADVDNLDERMLEDYRWTCGHVDWLRAMIADLEPEALTWGKVEFRDKTGGEDWGKTTIERAGVAVLLKTYGEWMDRSERMYSSLKKANVDDRKIQLAEDQGRMLASVITRILAGMFDALVAGLVDHDAARVLLEQMWGHLVGQIVPTELRAIAVSSEVAAS